MSANEAELLDRLDRVARHAEAVKDRMNAGMAAFDPHYEGLPLRTPRGAPEPATAEAPKMSSPDGGQPGMFDVPGLAAHLGTSERHIRDMVYKRRIPYYKVGRLVRFDPDEVAEWLRGARVSPLE